MSNTFAASLRQRMSGFARHLGTGITVGALVFVAACSADRAMGPSADAGAVQETASKAILATGLTTSGSSLISSTALLRTTPLEQSITRSVVVTAAAGGSIAIPEAGVKLEIPPGAIKGNSITITMTAMAGSVVAYTFEPHGTAFRESLKLQQDLNVTTWANSTGRMLLGGGYFVDDSQVNAKTGAAMLNELVPAVVSGSRLKMDLWHFSGYMVSMD